MGPPRTTTRFQPNADPLASGSRTVSSLCQRDVFRQATVAEPGDEVCLRRLGRGARKLDRDDAVEIGKSTPALVET
jgi:hypothetical protein